MNSIHNYAFWRNFRIITNNIYNHNKMSPDQKIKNFGHPVRN